MIYIILIISLFIFINLYFKLADKYNIIDKPNHRSSHKKITLRGGGVIFYFGVLFFFLWSGFKYPFFFLGLTGICLVSFVDDIREIPRRVRLGVQFTSVILLLYQVGLMNLDWWILPIALILTTGIINAYNFMDGINGITGGYSLVVLAGLYWVNIKYISFVDQDLILSSLLSIVVFSFYNFRRTARCFAGDVGSVGLAFLVVFLLGRLIVVTDNYAYIGFLSVYGVDSVLTITHRFLLKENIFQPHRKHMYQLLANELNVPHLVVAACYALLQLMINLGLVYFRHTDEIQCYYSAIIILVLAMLYAIFKFRFNRVQLNER